MSDSSLCLWQFLRHNLTVEAAWPELFVDGLGTYWDVPFSMAIDLASTASDSGASYHFSINHNAGRPKQHEDQVTNGVPTTLLPGLCIKNAFAFKKTVDFWRSKASKLKLVQPFDMFLSNPHISASGYLVRCILLTSSTFLPINSVLKESFSVVLVGLYSLRTLKFSV